MNFIELEEKKMTEKKSTVQESTVTVQESKVMEEKVEKVEEQNTKLFVERDTFTGSDGKKYWNYFLRAKIRERDKKINFSPKDKGGYDFLDMVFEIADKAELVMTTSTMKDDAGKRTKYTSYKLVNIDEEGTPFEASVKPSQDSDKNMLAVVLHKLKNKGV